MKILAIGGMAAASLFVSSLSGCLNSLPGAVATGRETTLPVTQPPASSGFPFVIPWDDSAPTATSVAELNPAPLTEKQRLSVKNGHFYDQNGRRVRFVGTNIGAGACFPTKEDAPKIAARLRKFGINLVRLHHMDASWATPSIFRFSGGYDTTTELDPQSLDRLDFFVAELKKNGIYIDLNLHVSREWRAADGFPEAKLPELGKVVAYFHPRAIELQKQYASQFLTHKNPYTGQRWADDPAIALIELNNEDSLLGSAGQAASLPGPYRLILTSGWNDFLKRKYKTTAALKAAWGGAGVPMGKELIKADSAWSPETHEQTDMKLAVESAAGQTNGPTGKVLHISDLKTDGTNWHLQVHQTGIALEAGKTYTLSFAARASAPRTVFVNARLHQAPWSMVGLDQSIALDTAWKRYSFTFVANGNVVADKNRISLMLGDNPADVFIGDLSLRPGGGGSSLEPGQTLEAGNIDLATVSGSPAGRDYVSYLMEVEDRYTQALRDQIRKTGSKAAVACSQASYGGIGGVLREARLDWVDMHSYWQHPSFPGSAFDPGNYRIENTAMVTNGGAGTLDGLAMHRVEGKPFTVSEYDHPAPSEWSAEMVPLIFAYAAWQDWDGVFLFAYEPGKREHISGFFDQAMHPAKLGFLPAAAMLFLRGDLAPTAQKMTLEVPKAEVPQLKGLGTDYAFWAVAEKREIKGNADLAPKKADAAAFLTHQATVRFVEGNSPLRLVAMEPAKPAPPGSGFVWNPASRSTTVQSPASKMLIGMIATGETVAIPGLSARLQKSERGFGVITLTARDGKPTERSGSLLLTVLDKAENTGLQWNAERTFAANAWTTGPTLLWSPSGSVSIATTAKQVVVHALDGNGKRVRQVPVTLSDSTATFEIGPQHRTMWYEIEASLPE